MKHDPRGGQDMSAFGMMFSSKLQKSYEVDFRWFLLGAFFTLKITISCDFYTKNHIFLRFLH